MKYVVFLLIGLIFLSGCVNSDVIELQDIEIRNYEGEDLSSITEVKDLSINGPQTVDIAEYRLDVTGLVDAPQYYTYDEVLQKQHYSKVVEIYCVTGWDAKVLWEGVLLKDVFEDASVKQEADTVIFYAVDGYSTSLPLNYIVDNNIMLAYKINNVTLTPSTGYPFMLVAEQKWGYKWIKWVNKIELSDNPEYGGYWESRGYSNEGNLEEGFYK